MKPFLLLPLFLLCYILVPAQKQDFPIYLKTRKLSVESNISATAVEKLNQKAARMNHSFFGLLQFESLPSEQTKRELALKGIILLDYIPKNTYTFSIKGKLDPAILKKARARAILELAPQDKMSPELVEVSLKKTTKSYKEVWVSFPKNFTATEVINQLKTLGYEVTSGQLESYRILPLKVPVSRLSELAELSIIEYIQPAPPKDEPLNFNSRTLSKAHVLNTSVANNGKGLNGEGVVIGVGDDANVMSHVDFSGRIIDHASANSNFHGTHTTGTVAGAGIINEASRGYVSKATVISQAFSNILWYTPDYVNQYGMLVTNNSYGNTTCSYNGTYDMVSQFLDNQIVDHPGLQHVFAAGNSGSSSCSYAPPGFRTVLGGYQSAKNIIAVGNMDGNENIYSGSSKGPVRDGRIKPEIAALGDWVYSTAPNNSYGYAGGTSMAAPAVTGGLALLYQRYRQLHGNTNPKSALMKALLCNGATDKGNIGPDFSFGFGEMNLLRSIDMLEQNRLWNSQVKNADEKQFTFTVPANTAQLKVMLYWHDPASSVYSSKMLVNDLDLQVLTPDNQTLYPYILDTSAARLTAVATTGPDHINNIEQVSLNSPQAGTYTVHVKGTEIAQNPEQEFFVVYDIVPESVVLTYPVGGVAIAPGENTRISWESYGNNNNTFSLDYSIDGGTTWTSIPASLTASSRFYNWTVPSTVTDNALVRVTKADVGQSSSSGAFTIIGTPTIASASVQCEGYFNLTWTAVSNATDYEVMMLKGDEMIPIATTTATNYSLSGLSKDSTYWVSVRARINGKAGRRPAALSRKPSTGTCAGNISDHDLALNAIVSPVTGRKFTSSELTNTTQVKVEIKNLDDEPVSSFTVKYSIDGGQAWTEETVNQNIAAQSTYTHTFTAAANLSAVGTYQLLAIVKAANDNNSKNDTLNREVKHLDNQPLNLTAPFLDDLETALSETYTSNTVGLKGADRYDLSSSTPYGRLRTFFYSGFASSGTKAINLDAYRALTSTNVNSLTATFNLSGYSVNTHELRLDFRAFSHGQVSYANNKVWVRGADHLPWLEVYDLSKNNTKFSNQFGLANNIEFGDTLLKYGQNVSSSFQIKWGQEGLGSTISSDGAYGYSFDDISIYKVDNDIQMVNIDEPAVIHCGLNNSVPLKVTLRNCTNYTIADIPVRYSINDGSWFTETISSLAGNTTLQYTFSNGLPLTGEGIYNIKVIADIPSDSYRLNDTAMITLRNLPLITSFPYLENFEQGTNGWYSGGSFNSWEFGQPASTQINRAASGVNAWKTNLTGTHNNLETSYLYSPCFNITGMLKPTLSFSVALDLEDCGVTQCDAAWVEYSTDGKNWSRLVNSNAYNWYPNSLYWSVENYTRWHLATVSLPVTSSNIMLRFVLKSDPYVTREGVAIDDIHIYDNVKGIYVGESLAAPITKTINGGNGWIDFESAGKLIASIQPNNQDLGTTEANVFVNKSGVRNTNNLYYLDRSYTVKPANTALTDSVTLRLYFLDSEVEAWRQATGCNTCPEPSNAYGLGIADFEGNTAIENGTVADNNIGSWSFYPSGKVVKVPFDKGYYAEFKVKDFSEFWFSEADLGDNTVLPIVLTNFQVQKVGQSDAVISWIVGSEWDVDRYEIEMANENSRGQQSGFGKIGQVASLGDISQQRQYAFTDKEFPKSGVRNYRLKIIDKDGTFTYSDVKSIRFADTKDWMVYPNPSKEGKFYFVYQLDRSVEATVQLTDAIGRLVKTYNLRGSGFAEKLLVDISANTFANGVYLLKIFSGERELVFKIYKQ